MQQKFDHAMDNSPMSAQQLFDFCNAAMNNLDGINYSPAVANSGATETYFEPNGLMPMSSEQIHEFYNSSANNAYGFYDQILDEPAAQICMCDAPLHDLCCCCLCLAKTQEQMLYQSSGTRETPTKTLSMQISDENIQSYMRQPGAYRQMSFSALLPRSQDPSMNELRNLREKLRIESWKSGVADIAQRELRRFYWTMETLAEFDKDAVATVLFQKE